MKDFWAFRTMVTPVLIQIIFWVGVFACLAVALVYLITGATAATSGGGYNLLKGLATLIFGPLLVRVYCEILIVIFRINETLTEIKHALERRPED